MPITTRTTKAELCQYLARAERDYANETAAHKETIDTLDLARADLRGLLEDLDITRNQLRATSELMGDYEALKARAFAAEERAKLLRQELGDNAGQRARAQLAEQALRDLATRRRKASDLVSGIGVLLLMCAMVGFGWVVLQRLVTQ